MRKLIGVGAILGSVFAVWACSSSSSQAPSGNNNENDSGSTGTDTGTPVEAGASCSASDINSMLAAQGYSLDAGADGGAVAACVQTTCKSDIDACATESCATCEQAILSCAVASCVTALPTFDAGPAPDGTVQGPECKALSACCSELSTIAMVFAPLATYATVCTTNAAADNEANCAQTAATVNSLRAGICPGPDGG
jgi:hypothetical protein